MSRNRYQSGQSAPTSSNNTSHNHGNSSHTFLDSNGLVGGMGVVEDPSTSPVNSLLSSSSSLTQFSTTSLPSLSSSQANNNNHNSNLHGHNQSLQSQSQPQPQHLHHNNSNNNNVIYSNLVGTSKNKSKHINSSASLTSNSLSSATAVASKSSSIASSSASISGQLLSSIEEKVARLYYRHGLICSRHPLAIILLSVLVVLISSYPIFTFRGLFGSSSELYFSSPSVSDTLNSNTNNQHPHPRNNNNIDPSLSSSSIPESNSDSIFQKHLYFLKQSNYHNNQQHFHSVPRWFQSNLSYAYVQQITIRSAVIPWQSELQLVDALRGPLEHVFELVEAISNYQYRVTDFNDISLSDVCLQVAEPTLNKRYSDLTAHLPSYSCLTLSPASVWRGDIRHFLQDNNFLSTLLKFQDATTPLPSGALHKVFFGVSFDETGIRRTYGRNRPRTITYSITLILRRNVPSFIEGLEQFLVARYPLSSLYYGGRNVTPPEYSSEQLEAINSVDPNEVWQPSNETLHIYFQKTFTSSYLIPLALFYSLVCLYMYFSVRKMELVRNKFLYAFCALVTVLMSVFMSFGICFRLGFNSVMIVNRLLPYFVAGIGFENMLVMTKSVLAIPHLDTKVRVAQGLSKEGLSITKNLLAELTLLTIGSFTFVPFFQECCIFAAVCLCSDFFIQVTFFTAIFSIDIQRINERSINQKKRSTLLNPLLPFPKNIHAQQPGRPVRHKVPKRLRFVYFLARIRLVQRGLMLLLSACIGIAIYNAYLVLEQQFPVSNQYDSNYGENSIAANVSHKVGTLNHHRKTNPQSTVSLDQLQQQQQQSNKVRFKDQLSGPSTPSASTFPPPPPKPGPSLNSENLDQLSMMELLKSSSESESSTSSSLFPHQSESSPSTSSHSSINPYGRVVFTQHHPVPSPLTSHHWSNIFSLYNISLVGRFISILPPILLSIPVTPQKARAARNLADSDFETLRKFVPMKFSNGEYVISDDDFDEYYEMAGIHFFSSWSRTEVYITAALLIPSLIFFIYIFILLYRCVCTRNYAEWRTQLSTNTTQKARKSFGRLNSLLKFFSFGSSSSAGSDSNKIDKYFHFDISLLSVDPEREIYKNDNQFLLHNQDIDLIATNGQSSLVGTVSMSGDIRAYDALTCETLAFIQRSKAVGSKNYTNNNHSDNDDNEDDNDNASNQQQSSNSKKNKLDKSSQLIAKTCGNLLKTIVDGINVENDDNDNSTVNEITGNGTGGGSNEQSPLGQLPFKPIWCLEIFDRFILAGCEDGRLEVWNAYTGQLSFVYYPDHLQNLPDSSMASITTMRVTYWGVVLARLNGVLDLLEVDQNNKDNLCRYSFSCDSEGNGDMMTDRSKLSIRYRLKQTLYAHRQPIARLEIIDSLEDEDFIKTFGSRGCLITGSHDSTLKVFSLDNAKSMYTLNGHCGGIVITSIDQYSTATALSGCQLGQLCVWDLNTGTCIFSMQAHSQAEVLAITASPLYYVSSGTDNRICIWDRYSGHLVHSISQQHSNCRSMMFLESHILITVRDCELIVWDVNDARQICIVSMLNTKEENEQNKSTFASLIKSYQSANIKRLCFAYQRNVLVCDYGNSLCVISNPLAMKKLD